MSDSDEDLRTLIDKSSPKRASPSRSPFGCRLSLPHLFGAGAVAVLLYVSVFSFASSNHSLNVSDKIPILENNSSLIPDPVTTTKTVTLVKTVTEIPVAAATPFPVVEDGILDMSLEELREMVQTTQGYYVRDWSLGLGWNNMRYIIEAAIEHAHLLNRTLVLPSFVYARACEYEISACAAYARMVNKNDALQANEWASLPSEKQMAWRIPLEVMIDLPHLRRRHPVMLTSEYLRLQGLDTHLERSNGAWDRDYYHSGSDKPSLFVIPNYSYETENFVRVDSYPPTGEPMPPLSSVGQRYDELLGERATENNRKWVEWSEAQVAIYRTGVVKDEAELEQAIREAGWVILHTWDGAVGIDFIKSVVKPIKQVARHDTIRGLVEDYRGITKDVLLAEGELHLGRKPGFVKFTTESERDSFGRLVLHDLRVTPRVRALAATISERMTAINHGRTWMGAHMRRGDFVTAGWSMEPTIQQHFERIMNRLKWGREILEHIHGSVLKPYEVPGVVPNPFLMSRDPPLIGDTIYLATDERSPEAIQYLHENRALLFQDVVSLEDRRIFGWPIMFSDIIALVEQTVLGTSAGYFYGHAMSSVAGGILNLRAGNGMDYRTALLD